jgi:hypothetical protein
MTACRSIAALAIVTMLGTALPARAASRSTATDLQGTSAAVPTSAKTPTRFQGFHPSWKTWVWIGVGGVIFCGVARGARK